MIEYETVNNKRKPSDVMRVYVDQRAAGTIRLVEGGFRYFPLNNRVGGELFKTVREVQMSLEGDDDEQPTTS